MSSTARSWNGCRSERTDSFVVVKFCECDAFVPLSVRRDQCALKTFLRMQQKDHILHHFFPQFLPLTNHTSLPIMNTHRRATSFTPYCSFLYNRQFFPSSVNPRSVSLAFFHFFFLAVHVNLYLVLIDFHSLDNFNKRSLLTYLLTYRNICAFHRLNLHIHCTLHVFTFTVKRGNFEQQG